MRLIELTQGSITKVSSFVELKYFSDLVTSYIVTLVGAATSELIVVVAKKRSSSCLMEMYIKLLNIL